MLAYGVVDMVLVNRIHPKVQVNQTVATRNGAESGVDDVNSRVGYVYVVESLVVMQVCGMLACGVYPRLNVGY